MTLPPERIGDKGQRYQVEVLGYPKDGWSTIGWSPDLEGAKGIGRALSSAPRTKAMRVRDRQTDKIVAEEQFEKVPWRR